MTPSFPLLIVDDVLWPADSVATLVRASQMPETPRRLLAHQHHMTVVVEEHYQQSVEVRVLESGRSGDLYHRRIVLHLAGTKQVVQYGLVRIDLSCCAPPVREAIVSEKVPLGRVLIEHNVLRRVEPTALIAVDPGPTLQDHLQLRERKTLYGRTGVIFCDDRPAIAVLEILV